MNIYETKNRGKIKELLSPPHIPREGEGAKFDLPCTRGQLHMDAKLFNGTTKYKKNLIVSEII